MAVAWLVSLIPRVWQVIRAGNLQPVDESLGEGPFRVRLPTVAAPFRVMGTGVVSSIREMYVRDGYLRGGVLAIRDGDVCVDLGANIGNFTSMALAHGPRVRVVAVEPSRGLNAHFETSLALNPGFRERVKLVRAFLGDAGDKQKAIIAGDEDYRDAAWISEAELVGSAGIDRVDVLKCDIEGGEFALLGKGSRLLELAQSLAIEIHAFAGDVEGFVRHLVEQGFVIRSRQDAPDGSTVVLASRR